MDNHPIPQDVTGFQFRLIGDMTIKQFAYLAAGAVLGWLTLSSPLFFIIKFFLAVGFVGTGILLAFIPIGGRPADNMILYFFKAVFSPSQYVYQQHGGLIPQGDEKVFIPQSNQNEKKEEKKDEDGKIHFESMHTTLATSVLHPQQQVPTPPSPQESAVQPLKMDEPDSVPAALHSDEGNTNQLTEEAAHLSEALQEAKKEEDEKTQGTQEAELAHEKVGQLEDQLQEILAQKDALEKKLLELQQQLSQKPQQVFTPSTATEPPKETAHVRKIPTSLGTSVGAPLINDVPNLISGVVKDPRGNVLPNILIEVKDKDNNPVRAFKTNALGQFASATPVLNGVYTITFEDPADKQRFDSVEITATGDVLLPLEVISVDQREELRRELFGSDSHSAAV